MPSLIKLALFGLVSVLATSAAPHRPIKRCMTPTTSSVAPESTLMDSQANTKVETDENDVKAAGGGGRGPVAGLAVDDQSSIALDSWAGGSVGWYV